MWVSSWLRYIFKGTENCKCSRTSEKLMKICQRSRSQSIVILKNEHSVHYVLFGQKYWSFIFFKYESKSEFKMGNQPLSGIGLRQTALLIRRTFPSTKLNSNFTKVSPLFDLCVEQFLYKFWEFHTISLIKVWNWYWINIT